jgi:HSP20 family protein
MLPRFLALTHTNGIDELLRGFEPRAATTPLDIYEHDDRFEVWLDVPGVNKEDIKLSLEGETLRIQGERPARAETEQTNRHFRRTERWSGRFSRSLTLPSTVDGSRIEAKLEEGVLKVVLPKRDQAKPRDITIN